MIRLSVVVNVRKRLEKINNSGEIRTNEPMALHTTFKTGGPADLFIIPGTQEELGAGIRILESENIPWFILGGGANILVADRGIRGAVLSTERLNRITFSEKTMTAECGADVSTTCRAGAEQGISVFPFLYGMPGTVGGALYMNARCYGHEISESVKSVSLMSPEGILSELYLSPDDWAYKKSPFQNRKSIITRAVFTTENGNPDQLMETLQGFREDRETKGHYRAPCAGSTFKNNRLFGQPSGKIIDEAGFRGAAEGDARVSEWHANIIINNGNARSGDIWTLVKRIQGEILNSRGFLLEPEIIPVGDWEDL